MNGGESIWLLGESQTGRAHCWPTCVRARGGGGGGHGVIWGKGGVDVGGGREDGRAETDNNAARNYAMSLEPYYYEPIA